MVHFSWIGFDCHKRVGRPVHRRGCGRLMHQRFSFLTAVQSLLVCLPVILNIKSQTQTVPGKTAARHGQWIRSLLMKSVVARFVGSDSELEVFAGVLVYPHRGGVLAVQVSVRGKSEHSCRPAV